MTKKSESKSSVLDLGCVDAVEWDALTPKEIILFNSKVSHRTYSAGENIFIQDDPCKGLYIIESGLVAVRKMDDEGRSVVIRLGYPGDSLGYRPLIAKESHRASAEVTKETRVCFLDAKTTMELVMSNPGLGMRFLERTVKALGEVEERFFEVAAQSVRIRLVHLLILLRDKCGRLNSDGTLVLNLPLTRQDLASMIGARPESVSRAFLELKKEGLAESSGREIHVARFDRLIEELHATTPSSLPLS